MSLNSPILFPSSSIPARIISSGFKEPVDSTVRILSSSLSVSTRVAMLDEFHFACSLPRPSLA